MLVGSDWREELAAADAVYEQIYPGAVNILDKKTTKGSVPSANRKLPNLVRENLMPQNKADFTFKPDHYTLHTVREAIEVLNDLEDKFKKLTTSAYEQRRELLVQSNELSRLLKYKSKSDIMLKEKYGNSMEPENIFDTTKTPVFDSLKKLHSDSFSLRRDLDVFMGQTMQTSLAPVLSKLDQLQDKVTSLAAQEEADRETKKKLNVLSQSLQNDVSAKSLQLERHQRQLDLVHRRRLSLGRRCAELGKEVDTTALLVEPVQAKTRPGEQEDVPLGTLCLIDLLQSSWSDCFKLQGKKVKNNRCKNFVALMTSRMLPVCDFVYDFIGNPDDYANILAVSDYSFAAGELSSILSFLVTSPSARGKIHHLSLHNCGVSDRDCRSIAVALTKLPRLHSISLRDNCISSIGAMALFTRIWELQGRLKLVALCLDGNQIGQDGALSLSQVLPLCPDLKTLSIARNPLTDTGAYYIMRSLISSKRRAHREFPAPGQLAAAESNAPDASDFASFVTGEGTVKSSTIYDEDEDDEDASDEAAVSSNEDQENNGNNRNKKDDLDDNDDLSHASVETNDVVVVKAYVARAGAIRAKLKAIGYFLNFCSRGHRLSSLNISGCSLTHITVSMLAVIITETYVSEICYSDNMISLASSKILAHAIANSILLRTLVIQNARLSDNAIKLLIKACNKSSSLLTVDLSRNTIGPAGANWIAGATKHFFIDSLTVTSAVVNKGETSGGRKDLGKETLEYIDQLERLRLDSHGRGRENEEPDDEELDGKSVTSIVSRPPPIPGDDPMFDIL